MRGFIRFKSTNSALSERFEQILQEKILTAHASALKNHPSLGSDLVSQEDFAKMQLESKAQDTSFKHTYQRELGYVQSESKFRLKEERENADPYFNRPWSGSELIQDTARRMIIDSMPKAKKIDTRPKSTVMTPPMTLSERIQSAKELSLDYKVGKALTPEEKERKEFQEMYKEKLLGPSMFLNSTSSASTVGLITSMAEARINAEIDQKTGTFNHDDMHSVRGKPLSKERLENSTDTAYFMNEVLKKQDCLPTWIENQQGVDIEISNFRSNLQKLALKAFLNLADPVGDKSVEEILLYKAERGSDLVKSETVNSMLRSQGSYLTKKTNDINQKVRTYNLLAPSSSLHKWKLVLDTEVLSQVNAIFGNIAEELNNIKSSQKKKSEQMQTQSTTGSLLGIFGGEKKASVPHSIQRVIERPREPMRFWHLVKTIFRE